MNSATWEQYTEGEQHLGCYNSTSDDNHYAKLVAVNVRWMTT